MSENPYQPPLTDIGVVGVKSGRPEDVRAVAVYQKGVIWCILVNLLAFFSQFAIPEPFRPLIGLVLLLAGLVGFVFVLLLSIKVYNTAVGILLSLLTVIPLVNLLILLSVNGKATKILKSNGHRVGLLGAKLSEFSPVGQAPRA